MGCVLFNRGKTMRKPRVPLRIVVYLPALVVLGGCAGATYVPTGAIHPAKAKDCVIEVFSAELPDREFEEIGILQGEGSFWKADMDDVLPKLREEACLAGGDAIILQSAGRYAAGEHGVENMYAFATVIRWERE
jgi:hypothetical protein